MDLLLRLLLGLLGCVLLVRRLGNARRGVAPAPVADASEVSIIVPARNEAENLPRLLRSLVRLRPAPREIIVVDDGSTDGTGDLARAFGVTVVVPEPLPRGLVGKPWACVAGVRAATGRVFLFTDADTEHDEASLGIALAALREGNTGLVSALPTHRLESWWEKLQGPFQLLLLIATRAGKARASGQTERRFAIGQYLLLRRKTYDDFGGHARIGKRIAEDLAMARAVVEGGEDARVLFVPGLFKVRMYPGSIAEFVAGWRRNFRDGFGAAGFVGMFELFCVITYLLGVPLWGLEAALRGELLAAGVYGCAYLATAWFIRHEQRNYGPFSGASALAYPLCVTIFVLVSALAAVDALLGRKIMWRGRSVELGG
jgi:4,4'-diaponeurosporenoate glycosyltransferase